jgi:hypothetical protein
MLSKIMLVWQILVLNAVYSIVSIAFPAKGEEQRTVPSSLIIFVAAS